jgi:integrase
MRPDRAAPFNPNPRWPDGYFQVLAALGVEERRHPFYVHWVRRFFDGIKGEKRRGELGVREIEDFIERLSAEPGVAGWQVAQARDALEVYYEQFRGNPLEPRSADMSEKRTVRAPEATSRTEKRKVAPKVDLGALENAIRVALRTEHYALKTERAYIHCIRRFVGYHRGKRPSDMGGPEIHHFLSHLAMNDRMAASTQNQALNAIVFLYRKVIKKEPGDFSTFPRARRPKRLPTVLSRQDVQAFLSRVDGAEGLLIRLLYGTGMRLSEGLRLRVQDLAFDRSEITVRAGKGDKDKRVSLPASLKSDLYQHPDGPGTPRPRGRQHHHDLHPRTQQRPHGRRESIGHAAV